MADESHAVTFQPNPPALPAYLHFDNPETSLGVSVQNITHYRYVSARNIGTDEETEDLFELHMIGGDVAMFHGSKAVEAYALFLSRVSS